MNPPEFSHVRTDEPACRWCLTVIETSPDTCTHDGKPE